MSVRLSVVAFGFKGSFAKFALPEFKTGPFNSEVQGGESWR
jgi:hypothetical protein